MRTWMFFLLALLSCGLVLRSPVNHKAVEECSFRPGLFQFIMTLLFSTMRFFFFFCWESYKGFISFSVASSPRKAEMIAAVFVKLSREGRVSSYQNKTGVEGFFSCAVVCMAPSVCILSEKIKSLWLMLSGALRENGCWQVCIGRISHSTLFCPLYKVSIWPVWVWANGR